MKQEDAIMAVMAAIGRGEMDEPEHYELFCSALKIAFRAAYRAGGEFIFKEKDGTREIPKTY